MTSLVSNEPADEHSGDAVSAGMSRRSVISAAGVGALALGLGAAGPAARAGTGGGPGPVAGAPHLPAGFWNTFTSRYIRTGDLVQHVVIGGQGPPLLLVHGWPQTWYAWRLVMPGLARDFTVIVPDQRGRGVTGKPAGGYDTATLAGDLAALMDALGYQRFAVAGADTGMVISTRWPPITATGSRPWPSPRPSCRACRTHRRCSCPQRPTSISSTSCSTGSPR